MVRKKFDHDDGKVRVFDAVSGGDALLVLDVGLSCVMHWSHLKTWRRARRGSRAGQETRRCASSTRSRAARRWSCSRDTQALVDALTAFTDPATGEPRLVSGSNDVRVWNPAAGGAAIEAEPEGHSDDVNALVTFVDPATGALRVATGSNDKTIRVWDAETGGALLVIDVGSWVNALAFFVDPATGAPRLACGCDDGKVRVFDPVAGGEALLVIDVGSRCTRWRSSRTRRRARRGSLCKVYRLGRCVSSTRSLVVKRWS